MYLDRVGGDKDHPGADLVSFWYARNLHIVANMMRDVDSTGDGDRVVLSIGQGHAKCRATSWHYRRTWNWWTRSDTSGSRYRFEGRLLGVTCPSDLLYCRMSRAVAKATDGDQHQMKIISLNTGLPREVTWHGRSVSTGIFKYPVHGRVALRKLNLDGDRQADLSVHGGQHKAVYCYPLVHYDYWKRELPDRELPMGIFGENFTLDDLREEPVHIGDRFSVGSAEVIVTQPRLPCYKLGVRFESDDMVKRFFSSGRTGFYLAVAYEGEVGPGDEMRVISRDPNGVPVSQITRLYAEKRYSNADVAWVQRALRVAALPESWKEYFRQRLEQIPA